MHEAEIKEYLLKTPPFLQWFACLTLMSPRASHAHAALQWWREEDMEWKIWKERDYFIITRSKTVEGATVKEEFHFRIERLYYKEKVPDIIQSKAKADLGSQHAATFVEGQCQTFDRFLESGVPGSQDLATESS